MSKKFTNVTYYIPVSLELMMQEPRVEFFDLEDAPRYIKRFIFLLAAPPPRFN